MPTPAERPPVADGPWYPASPHELTSGSAARPLSSRTPAPVESWTSGAVGCGGTVGATPAGPAMPGVTVVPPLRRAGLPPPAEAALPSPAEAALPPAEGSVKSCPPNSPSAARAWEILMASIVMSCRISERLQARSASSHMVVTCIGLVPVTSARATIAPFGASSRPFR